MAFSGSIDMVCPSMSHHHKRVAYIAYHIATEMGLTGTDRADILIAALLHDCGAIQDNEKLIAGQYDFGISPSERHAHGYKGWELLRGLEEFKPASEIVKFHHIHWDEPASPFTENEKIPAGSYILHLADRIDILLDRREEVLAQRKSIESKIRDGSGKMFMPEAVEAFLKLSAKEYFWFDLVAPFLDQVLAVYMGEIKSTINIDGLMRVAGMLNKIIDFRSGFTATHSAGVAECAGILSSKLRFSGDEVKMMYIAGLLHDLGKLAVPVGILEKRGPLDKNELNIIKKHTFYSFRILESIPQLELINRWASFHHEHIDGRGYPFKIGGKELGTGSRIMAVSDVFTALAEKRPYRDAMPVDNALGVMETMVKSRHLDADVFSALKQHIDEIEWFKSDAQQKAASSFRRLQSAAEP